MDRYVHEAHISTITLALDEFSVYTRLLIRSTANISQITTPSSFRTSPDNTVSILPKSGVSSTSGRTMKTSPERFPFYLLYSSLLATAPVTCNMFCNA